MTPLSRRSLVRGAALTAPLTAALPAVLPAASSAATGPLSLDLAPARAGAACASGDRVAGLLARDMTGRHAGLMHGVPLTYNWARHPRVGAGNHAGPFHAVSAWGQVYEAAEGSPAANVRVACKDIALWIRSRSSGRWRQANASHPVNGANYVEDFTGNASVPAALRTEPDGSVSATLGGGYNFHLYSTKARAAIDPGDVGGVVCVYSARVVVDDPAGPDQRAEARYLASAGADYWLDARVAPGEGTVADVGIGKARWLTPHWTTLTMSTLSLRALRRSAPPVCLRGR